MSKGIYNSELVKRGETAIKVLSEVKKSKFEGKPDYIYVEIDGQERSLSSENPDYLDPLILHKGDVVVVRATGSRDSAKIEILESGTGLGKSVPPILDGGVGVANGVSDLPPVGTVGSTAKAGTTGSPPVQSYERAVGCATPAQSTSDQRLSDITLAVIHAAEVEREAWSKAEESMKAQIPVKDQEDMSLDTWYRILCHRSQNIDIYAQKELNK